MSNVLSGRIVQFVLDGIVREVANGAEVRLGPFGVFERVDLPAGEKRRGSRARADVRFKPGKRFRDALHL